MRLIPWMAVSWPALALCYVLFFRMSGRWKILPKCCATAICAATAAIGLVSGGAAPLGALLFWGIAACAVGDGLLEIHFISGMGVFALGHVLLISWLVRLSGGVSWMSLPLWALAYLGAWVLFRGELRKLGRKKAPFLLYAAFLMGMASVAALLPWRLGSQAVSVAIGGVLFATSDLMVARGFFGQLSPAMDRLALAIYYVAVYALALGAWLL
ncbi:MAG: lysoplasmalogenase family protein [Clostridia bacterium]|nr:lysoplasmalogenase family protein [Clostridia bacterium]